MQSLKLSAVGLIAMILAGGGCSAVSVTPDREIIDTATDTATPDTATPDTATPDTATPDTATPDTATPDTATPDTATPDTATPDTATPDTATPDTATPDTATPDTATPDTATPDTATPDTATPDTATPDTATPDTATPDTATPDTATPDTATPDTATPNPFDTASLSALYENSLPYNCSSESRACVNAETPYYSARIARDSSATTKLSKTLINVWANGGDTALPFSQLLPNNSEYICTLALNNSYCADSTAPIAVNYSSAYRGENLLPVAYADKVIVMNLLSEGFINGQGDRLIITPATDVSKKLMNVAKAAFSKISLRVGTSGTNTCTDINCVNVPLSNFDYADTIPNRYLLPVALAGLRAAQLFTLFPDAPNFAIVGLLKEQRCVLDLRCLAIDNQLAGKPYFSYTLKDFYENPEYFTCSASNRACVNAETPYYSALVARDSSATTKLSKTLINVWANDGSLYWGAFSQLLPGGSGYICVIVSATENCSASSAPIAVNLSSAYRASNLPSGYKDKVTVMNLLSEGWIDDQGDRLIITPATDVSKKLMNVAKVAFSKISLRVGTSGTNTCTATDVNCVNVPLSNFDDYGDNIPNKYLLPVALAGLRAAQLFTMFPYAPNVVVRDMLKTTNCLLLLECSAIGNSVNDRTPPWSFDLASYDLKALYGNPSFYPCASNGRACVNAETPYYSAQVARGGPNKTLINAWGNSPFYLRFPQLFPNNSGYICTLGSGTNYCSGSTAPIAVNFSSVNRANNLPSAYADKVTVAGPNSISDAGIVREGDRFIITPANTTLSGISLRVGTSGTNTCTGVNCVNVPLSNFDDYTNVTRDKLLPLTLAALRAAQLFTLFPNASNDTVVGMLRNKNCVLLLECSAIDLFFSLKGTLQDIYEHLDLYSCGGQACVNAETPYYSARVAKGGLNQIFLASRNASFKPLIKKLAPNYSCDNPCDAPIAFIEWTRAKIYVSDGSSRSNVEEAFNIQPSDWRLINEATLFVGTGDIQYEGKIVDKFNCDTGTQPCIIIPLSNFADYTGVDDFIDVPDVNQNNYQLPIALTALRAAQLFSIFPDEDNGTIVTMLKNLDCILYLQCLAIADSFTEDTGTSGSSGEASSTTGASASSGSASSAGSGSASAAGSSNSFIADIGSMTTYGKRQVFWSDGGLSVETRSHKIYRGGAHAMALAYRSMMGTLDITTGWTSQSSALGMEQIFLSGSSLGVFGALRYDAGSYLGMRPYVGVVASWHSMLETPKSITIMTANEVHVRAGVDVDVKGMRFALEGRCGQHQRLIGYGALSSALAETSCSTHLKASVSF